MGLRYERAVIQKLLQGVLTMKESVTYQAIIEEGEAKGEAKGKTEEARKLLRLLERFTLALHTHNDHETSPQYRFE
jgi:predicted transposase YdaD